MKNPISNLFNQGSNGGILKKPGDKLTAEITKSGKGVIKIKTNDIHQSATLYPNGTQVITTVKKAK